MHRSIDWAPGTVDDLHCTDSFLLWLSASGFYVKYSLVEPLPLKDAYKYLHRLTGKRRKSQTFLEKCKKCRELKCPWWLFWRLMGGSGKAGLLVLSQPSPCSRIFPSCQQLQWQATGGAEERRAVPWANSDTQGSASTVNPFFHLQPRIPCRLENIPRFSPFCLPEWLHLLRRKRYFAEVILSIEVMYTVLRVN